MSAKKPIVVPTIRVCARCGGSHDSVEFHALTQPLIVGEWVGDYWAMCPSRGEPIIASVKTAVPSAEPEKGTTLQPIEAEVA